MNSTELLKQIFIEMIDKFMVAYVRQGEFSKSGSKNEAVSLLEEAVYDWLVSKGLSVVRSVMLAKSVARSFADEPVAYILALADEFRRDTE